MICFRTRSILAGALLAMFSHAAATQEQLQEQVEKNPTAIPEKSIVRPDASDHSRFQDAFVDPDETPEQKLAKAGLIKAAADAGNSHAQFVMGALYRLGMEHPAKVFERDDNKAERYLSNAAIRGVIYAMAGMAELELRRKRAIEAMVWAQVFGHYEVLPTTLAASESNSSRAYTAYLLKRCFDAVGDTASIEEIQRDFSTFLAKHDRQISERPNRKSGCCSNPNFLVREPRESSPYTPSQLGDYWRLRTPGFAVFLLGVDAKGRISKAITLDSLPDHRSAYSLRDPLLNARFNPSADTQLRWGIQQMSYDDHSIKINSAAQ